MTTTSCSTARPTSVLRGYEVDPAALIDLRELRYQWLDHALKGGAAPAIVAERINFEVMGANEWRHAAFSRGAWPRLAEVLSECRRGRRGQGPPAIAAQEPEAPRRSARR